MKCKKILKNNPIILWRDLLDLGIEFSLTNLRKKKSELEAKEELKESLFRQSQEHWQGLYNAFKKLK